MASSSTDSADLYGPEAKELLQPLQPVLHELARHIADRFYETLARMEPAASVLGWLRENEFTRLRQRQAEYIAMLLSSELTQAVHLVEAKRAGKAHALVGVQVLWLIEAYTVYQDEIYGAVCAQTTEPLARERIMRIVSHRSLFDLQYQVSSYRELDAEITSAFSALDQHVASVANITDLVRGALDIIGNLSGDVCLFFGRADDRGELQIEQSYGAAAEQYHQAMEAGTVPRISIDPNAESGRGPGGRAWRSGEIVVSDDWLIESDKAPWQSIGEALGFRASAAVPLIDESGRSFALLSLYSGWPGFFSTDRARGFLRHVQRVLSHAVQQCMLAPVIPMREQQAYRQMLRDQRVVIHYQPVIDLTDGHLVKVEALARLCAGDGELISPDRFLPALGRNELLDLFKQGLKRACDACRALRAQQIDTKVAINFPAEGFDDRRYEDALFEILKQCDFRAEHLQLEVLETHDAGELTDSRKAFLQHLREAGVEIAEDDLGSGHSSLLRLDQYSFDEVKIDQGLVRSVLHNPKRAVEFILYLTRLAHAFDIPVTVEGLENVGLIEAAAVLGADRGQGYGIARPMPLDELPAWHRNFRYSIEPSKPRTAIGAMAGYLLWDMQLAALSERPELAADFVGARVLVEAFITANNLGGSRIDELLRRNQELAALEHNQGEAASSVRAQLIDQLTEHWLAEMSGA